MNARVWLILAGITGSLGIAIGAFGAHALPNLLSDLSAEALAERTAWLETGSRYHMYHAAALLVLALTPASDQRRGLTVAGVCWLLGIVLFSGSLYAMALSGIRVLGAVVPLGGVSLLIGWIALLFARTASPPRA